MSNSNSIINLGDLAKPATVLLEKISNALGGVFKPYQMVRVAKAEAKVKRIQAEAGIQVSELHERALCRFLEEEAKKQSNMEEITRQAIPQLADDAKPEEVDEDWIANFFDKCRITSDAEMQTLWSRVLAGEANEPGSFSKRTVNFLMSLDKTEAELFTKLCTFLWVIHDEMAPLVYDIAGAIYDKHGIAFEALVHLDSIGLIQFNAITGFAIDALPAEFATNYHGRPLQGIIAKGPNNEVDIGYALLTRTGHELARICSAEPDPEFWEYVREKWKGLGYLKPVATGDGEGGDNVVEPPGEVSP